MTSNAADKAPLVHAAQGGGTLAADGEMLVDVESNRQAAAGNQSALPPRDMSLPDLTGRLIKEGLLDEYTQYRNRYLEWRRGGTMGAVGELGVATVGTGYSHRRLRGQTPVQLLPSLPTPQRFDFFFTISYWIAVASVIGAMVASFAAIGPVLDWHKVLNTKLLAFFNVFANSLYTVSSFLSYVELVNLPDHDHIVLWRRDWTEIRAAVPSESRIGVMAYLVAVLIWDVSSIVEVLPTELEGAAKIVCIKVPSFLGACGFFLGGVCAVVHNRHRSLRDIELRASLMDSVGGFCFCVGGFAGFVTGFSTGAAKFSSYCSAIGMVLYLISGILMVKMWRGNDFGLLFFRSLNDVLRAGKVVGLSPDSNAMRIHASFSTRQVLAAGSAAGLTDSYGDDESTTRRTRLSVRGIIFIIIYCWLFSCCALNCMASTLWQEGVARHLTDAMDSLLWMLVIAIVLVLHSAVTSIPSEQPYRLAYMMARGTLLVAAISKTISLIQWVPDVHHPDRWLQ